MLFRLSPPTPAVRCPLSDVRRLLSAGLRAMDLAAARMEARLLDFRELRPELGPQVPQVPLPAGPAPRGGVPAPGQPPGGEAERRGWADLPARLQRAAQVG